MNGYTLLGAALPAGVRADVYTAPRVLLVTSKGVPASGRFDTPMSVTIIPRGIRHKNYFGDPATTMYEDPASVVVTLPNGVKRTLTALAYATVVGGAQKFDVLIPKNPDLQVHRVTGEAAPSRPWWKWALGGLALGVGGYYGLPAISSMWRRGIR